MVATEAAISVGLIDFVGSDARGVIAGEAELVLDTGTGVTAAGC